MSSTPYTSLAPQRSSRNYTLVALAVGLVLIASATFHQRERLPSLNELNTLVGEPYCTKEQLSTGRWEKDEVEPHTWSRLKQSVGYTCADDRYGMRCFFEDPLLQLPRLAALNSWRWKPEGCALRPFNADKLIHRLGANRRNGREGSGILFIGDSLTLQHAQSFECLVGSHVESGLLTDQSADNGVVLDAGAGRVDFIRSDYISQRGNDSLYRLLLPENEEPDDIGKFTRKSTHLVQDKEFVVLNTGPHWQLNSEDDYNKFRGVAEEVLTFFDRFPHVTLIFRASAPGHDNCSRYSAPLNQSADATGYNWADFDKYNQVWQEALASRPQHHYLDVFGPTSLRGDGHRRPDVDCLHYCLPGPPDTWTFFLYHLIMGL